MKNYFKILAISLISCSTYGQAEVRPEAGMDGTSFRMFNINGNHWDISSDYENKWKHKNTLDFVDKNGDFVMQLFP